MGTFFITGATGGIGTEAAIALAREGHRLIISARSDNPTGALLQRVHREVPNADVDIVMGDLSLVRDVRRMSEAVATLTPSLDGLLLNAGTAPARRQLTAEGMETGFAVNHLAPFVMAHKLLPLLIKGDCGRIVLTGSSDHLAVKNIDVGAARKGEPFSYTRAYAEAKFLAMASMFEYERRLRDQSGNTGVFINIADPGWTHTGLTREAPVPIKMMVALGRPFQNTTIDAAQVLTALATTTTESGTYVGGKGPSKLSDLVQNATLQAKAYDDTVALLQELDGGEALTPVGKHALTK